MGSLPISGWVFFFWFLFFCVSFLSFFFFFFQIDGNICDGSLDVLFSCFRCLFDLVVWIFLTSKGSLFRLVLLFNLGLVSNVYNGSGNLRRKASEGANGSSLLFNRLFFISVWSSIDSEDGCFFYRAFSLHATSNMGICFLCLVALDLLLLIFVS